MTNWDKATGPSEHLSWGELACHDGTPYPVEWKADRAVVLADVFEHIRSHCGNVPIPIRSAYRTKPYNDALRAQGFQSAVDSQHVQGRALDLGLPGHMTAGVLYQIVYTLARYPGSAIGGVGRYTTFVHVDVRPRVEGHLAVWDSRGQDVTRIA